MKEIKRIGMDLIIMAAVIALFGFEAHKFLPPPLQLLALKVILVSVGVLHAHIIRKIMFPKIDWNKNMIGVHYVAIAFYAIIPLCYAFGG